MLGISISIHSGFTDKGCNDLCHFYPVCCEASRFFVYPYQIVNDSISG